MSIVGILIGLVFLIVILALVAALFLPLLLPILIVLAFVFWIWMLVHAIRNENIGGNEKIAWVVAIALTHCLGALVYFFAGRTRRRMSSSPPMA